MPIRLPSRVKVTPSAPIVAGRALNVPYRKQEQTNWCWAGCAQMVFAYRGKNVAQCALANQLFGQSSCCQVPGSSLCNRGCAITEICRVYSWYGVSCSYVGSNVPYSTLCMEIDGDRPVEVGFAWN